MNVRDLQSRVIAGGAAGNLTVTGILKGDILVLVQDLTTGLNLETEFTVTADNTINNTSGTSTAGHATLILWEKKYGGGRDKFPSATTTHLGRATS